MTNPSAAEIRAFIAYLAGLTDDQVRGVLDKEKTAGREEYAYLARAEARRRNIDL